MWNKARKANVAETKKTEAPPKSKQMFTFAIVYILESFNVQTCYWLTLGLLLDFLLA